MNAAHSGTVVALDGEMAVVCFQRSSMCAHCGACLAAGEREMETRVKNSLNASVGDRVHVELSAGTVAGASFIAYCIPLAGLLLGVLIGSLFSEIAAIACGLGCCAIAYLLLRVLDKRFARMQSFQPRMISLVTKEEEDENGEGTVSCEL